MALAPDERAWEVSYKKVEDMWYAEFMFVDLEYDGFMVKMFLDGCGGYELRFDTNGCEYFMMADGELSLLCTCADEAFEGLLELEKLEEAA